MSETIDGTDKVVEEKPKAGNKGLMGVIGRRLYNVFKSSATSVNSTVNYSGTWLSNRFPASSNFVYKTSSAAINAAYGAVHFYDIATLAHCTKETAKDLYSAVFETTALALGKNKSELSPKIALWALGSASFSGTLIGVGMALVEPKDPKRIYADQCGDIGTYTYSKEPESDRYFANDRLLNIWGEAGIPKRLALWSNAIPYNPDVIDIYKSSPRIRQYIDLAVAEATIRNVPPALLVNLLHRESVGFNLAVVTGQRKSPAGAIGVAQFMPNTAKKYYDLSEADLGDWRKSIPAAAEHLSRLLKRYDNDVILTLYEYNGGRSSVEFARKETGNENLSGIGVLRFNNDRRSLKNQCGYIASAWHNESTKYAGIITGQSWSAQHYHKADISISYEDFAIDPAITAKELGSEPKSNVIGFPKSRPTKRPNNFAATIRQQRSNAAVGAELKP